MANNIHISREWAEGLMVGSGKLTFYKDRGKNIPAFVIKLEANKRELLIASAYAIGVKNTIYLHKSTKNLYKPEAILVIRDVRQLKSIILPMLKMYMFVGKHVVLKNWLHKIFEDKNIPERYKILPILFGNID